MAVQSLISLVTAISVYLVVVVFGGGYTSAVEMSPAVNEKVCKILKNNIMLMYILYLDIVFLKS